MRGSDTSPGRVDASLLDRRDPLDPLWIGQKLVAGLGDVGLDAALRGRDAVRTSGEVDLATRHHACEEGEAVVRVEAIVNPSSAVLVQYDLASWG